MVKKQCRWKMHRPCAEKTGQTPGYLNRTGCKKPAKDRQTQRQKPATPSRSVVRYKSRKKKEPDVHFWPLQNKGIKRELEIIPAELHRKQLTSSRAPYRGKYRIL